MPEPEPYDLVSLFTQAAQSVMAAQTRLDRELTPESNLRAPLPGLALSYSIPRVVVALEFGFQEDTQKKLLMIPLGKMRSQSHHHQLRFSLLAVPEAPPPLLESGQPHFSLLEPHFLLPQDEEAALWRLAQRVLRNTNNWDFIAADGTPQNATQVSDKLRRQVQQEVSAWGKELDKDFATRKLVTFKLDSAPTKFLLVRLTDKSKNDGLFVMQPAPVPVVSIYSFEDDDRPEINYHPLHSFAVTIRNWLRGTTPIRRDYEDNLPPEFASLAPLVGELQTGVAAALALLSSPTVPASSRYDLTEATLEISYSVRFGNETRMSFVERAAPDGSQQLGLVESAVLLRAKQRDNRLQIEADLAAPEFALSGLARQTFLAHVERSVALIAKEFGSGYEEFLTNPMYQCDVVVLLSYKGEQPKEEFLVIWPGRLGDQSRDFVFTCKREGDRLGKIRTIMRLEDTLAETLVNTPVRAEATAGSELESQLENEQYQAFHNFFHAVSIWRQRMSRKET